MMYRTLPVYFFPLGVFLSLPLWCLGQSCPLPLTLPPDTILCAPDQVPLEVRFPAVDLVDLRWSPASVLDDATILNPVAQVSEPTTFAVSVRHLVAAQNIANGTFQQGTVGFTSDYAISDTTGGLVPLLAIPSFWITDQAGAIDPVFTSCDATIASRDSVFFFRSDNQTSNIWCQTVLVAPETDYQFNLEYTTVQGQLTLDFLFNGQSELSITNNPDPGCSWMEASLEWSSAAASSVEICLQSSTAGSSAIDNISLQRICQTTDSVRVDIADLSAEFSLPTSFCAADTIVELDALLTPQATVGGIWQFDGQERFVINPTSFQPNVYPIAYTVSQGPCSVRKDTFLSISPAPEAGTPRPAPSLCPGEVQEYQLSILLTGQDEGGRWSTNNQSLAPALDPETGRLDLEGFPPGTHTFFYTVEGSGTCPGDQTEVQLIINDNLPVNLGADKLLTCEQPSIQLRGSNNNNANFRYQWFLNDSLLDNATQRRLTLAEAGRYRVEVTDVISGCTTIDSVQITSEVADIRTFVNVTDLGCEEGIPGRIQVDSVVGGLPPYLYRLDQKGFQPNGQFDQLEAGEYQLITQDVQGCEDTLFLLVENPGDFEMDLETVGNPILGLGENIQLRLTTDLRADQIDSIIWNPVPPNCDGCREAIVAPTEVTEYFVQIRNDKGCIRTDSVTVFIFIGRIVYIPNAFSPNNDGLNDFLSIFAGTGVERVDYLRIYDRFGSMIFEETDIPLNDISAGWNGRHQNGRRVPSGTYVYQTQIVLFDGRPVELKGEVYLMR